MAALRCLPLLLPLLASCSRVETPLRHATGFVAHMSCSCVFVSARPLEDCLHDLPDEAAWLDVEADPVARAVTARALWIETTAGFAEGRGCRLRD